MKIYTIIAALILSATCPATARAVDPVPTNPLSVHSKCVATDKNTLQTILGKKLSADLASGGIEGAKARVKLTLAAPASPSPGLDLATELRATKFTVAPVNCVAAPCNTPPAVTLTSSAKIVTDSCTVNYTMSVKYSGRIAASKLRITGSSESPLAVGGVLAASRR